MLKNSTLTSIENLRIEFLDSKDNDEWNSYVGSHPDSTIYHSLLWINNLAKESGQKNINLICRDQKDKIQGTLPLVFTRGFPLGIGGLPGARRISSLPRTPTSGLLTNSIEAEQLLIEKAINLVSGYKGYKLQLKIIGNKLTYTRPDFNFIPWRKTYIYEIPPQGEEIRFGNSRNHAAIKRAVNKAVRSGLKVRSVTTINELKIWHRMYLETMAFHMVPARSFDFFLNLWQTLSPVKLMRIDLAELENNKILAGSVYFLYNNTVIYGFNGSKRDLFDLRPNDLLHWNAIHRAQKEGYKYYDMGEVQKDQKGLNAYKSKWCNTTKQIYHYYYPQVIRSGTEEKIIDKTEPCTLIQKLWQNLPNGITEVIGKAVYKFL